MSDQKALKNLKKRKISSVRSKFQPSVIARGQNDPKPNFELELL